MNDNYVLRFSIPQTQDQLAVLTARTVQARVAAGSTSQSVLGLGGPYIYNEPSKKSSVFIGNLTWVSFEHAGYKFKCRM